MNKTPDIDRFRSLAKQCGICDHIDWERPMNGFHHKVFPAQVRGQSFVAKFPSPLIPHVGVVENANTEKKNIALVQEYFGDFYPGCAVHSMGNGEYYLLMPYITGREIDESARGNQRLQQVFRRNQQLERAAHKHLDLVGLSGFRKYYMLQKVQLANILETDDGAVHIIDHDLFDLRHPYSFVLSLMLRRIIQSRFQIDTD